MVLPQPLRKQASHSCIITAFMVLEFRPTAHQNNKQLHYWKTATPHHTFLLFDKIREIEEASGNPNGNLTPSINIHRDSHHSGVMMGGNDHYRSAFIKRIQHRLVLQVGRFITGTKWVLIGNGLERGDDLVLRQTGTL